MRLSEAIRLGAMWSPPRFDGWMDTEHRCALGAACDAVGIPATNTHMNRAGIDYRALRARFPQLMCHANAEMFGVTTFGTLESAIVRLNDLRLMTREQIAEWVATIEPAEPTEIPESHSAVAFAVNG